MYKYELTERWNQIKDLIPPKTSICGRTRCDPRELKMVSKDFITL